MKIGVCLFDEVKIAKEAWVSIAGSSAIRINDINELRSDVFWVTNLDYFSYRKLNLTHASNIADEQYFRTKLTSLIAEISSTTEPFEVVSRLALFLDRTHELGEKVFGSLSNAEYRYATTLQTKLLTSSLRKQPDGNYAGDLSIAILQATQENQAMLGRQFAKNSKLTTFMFPRCAYANWLLKKPYPQNNTWTPVSVDKSGEVTIGIEEGSQLRGTVTFLDKLTHLEQTQRAAIFRVAVLSMDKRFTPFAQFGSGANKYMRGWATLPEIIDLARYAKLEVRDGYISDLKPLPPLPTQLTDNSPFEYSFSKGLLMENVWSALATPVFSPVATFVSAVGAYMRAYDRIACGRVAAVFAQHGFQIGSYGMGRVQVSLRQGEEPIASKLAIECGLLPPMRMLSNV